MSSVNQARATLLDLYRTEGKAELVGGRIVQLMPTGRIPNRVAFRIARSLDDHATQIGKGEAYTDNIGFTVDELPSGRGSFSPDASYYDGPLPSDPMRFIEGCPTFAAEVRSESDYAAGADGEMAEKRADYFAAGTKVDWDVDTVAECINVYKASDPTRPTTYQRGQIAEAEPAVPGWRVPVDWVFG
jgi:Uma2 family endonuclease